MPTISARIRDGSCVRRHDNKYGPGITPHYLDSDQVGIVEFDSTLFTVDQAKDWLSAHDYHALAVTTPAGEEQADSTTTEKIRRYLATELSPASLMQDIDGGLLVPGVKLLAPGTWTDSTQKTPCRYTAETLERFAQNWTDRSYWSRHAGGTPRDITDRTAEIRNIRFEDGITADLFFHGTTTKSKDSIALLKAAEAGKVPWPYSSVEMFTRDKWIIAEKIFEAQEILFDGAAMVNQGACRTCRIRNNEWVQEGPEDRKEQEAPVTVDDAAPAQEMIDMTDTTKELEAKVETLKKELADLKAQKAPEPPKVEIPKELAELPGQFKELSARIEKIEKGPGDLKTQGGETNRDLEPGLPEYFVPVNRKTGTVGGDN